MLLILFYSVILFSWIIDAVEPEFKLLSFHPENNILDEKQAITAVYNLPVVPLGFDLGAGDEIPDEYIPFFITTDSTSPKKLGRYYWVSSTIVRFDPYDSWAPDLSVKVKINMNLSSSSTSDSLSLGENVKSEYYFNTGDQTVTISSISSELGNKITGNRWTSVLRSNSSIVENECLSDCIITAKFNYDVEIDRLKLVLVNYSDTEEVITDIITNLEECKELINETVLDSATYQSDKKNNFKCVKFSLKNELSSVKQYFLAIKPNSVYNSSAGRAKDIGYVKKFVRTTVSGPALFKIENTNSIATLNWRRARVFFRHGLASNVTSDMLLNQFVLSPSIDDCTFTKIDSCEYELECLFMPNESYTLSIKGSKKIKDGIGLPLLSSKISISMSDFSTTSSIFSDYVLSMPFDFSDSNKNASLYSFLSYPILESNYRLKDADITITRIDEDNISSAVRKARGWSHTTEVSGEVILKENIFDLSKDKRSEKEIKSEPASFEFPFEILSNQENKSTGVLIESSKELCYKNSFQANEYCSVSKSFAIVSAISYIAQGVIIQTYNDENGNKVNPKVVVNVADMLTLEPIEKAKIRAIRTQSGSFIDPIAYTNAAGIAELDVVQGEGETVQVIVEYQRNNRNEIFFFQSPMYVQRTYALPSDDITSLDIKTVVTTDTGVYKPTDYITYIAFTTVSAKTCNKVLNTKTISTACLIADLYPNEQYYLVSYWSFADNINNNNNNNVDCIISATLIDPESGATNGTVHVPATSSYGVRNIPQFIVAKESSLSSLTASTNCAYINSNPSKKIFRANTLFNPGSPESSIIISNPRLLSVFFDNVIVDELWTPSLLYYPYGNKEATSSEVKAIGYVNTATGTPLRNHLVSGSIEISSYSYFDENDISSNDNDVLIYTSNKCSIWLLPKKQSVSLRYETNTDDNGKFEFNMLIPNDETITTKLAKLFKDISWGSIAPLTISTIGITGESVSVTKDLIMTPSQYILDGVDINVSRPVVDQKFIINASIRDVLNNQTTVRRNVKIYLIETIDESENKDVPVDHNNCPKWLKYNSDDSIDHDNNTIVSECLKETGNDNDNCILSLPRLKKYLVLIQAKLPIWNRETSNSYLVSSQCQYIGDTLKEWKTSPLRSYGVEYLQANIPDNIDNTNNLLQAQIVNPFNNQSGKLFIIWSFGKSFITDLSSETLSVVTLYDNYLPSDCESGCSVSIFAYSYLDNKISSSILQNNITISKGLPSFGVYESFMTKNIVLNKKDNKISTKRNVVIEDVKLYSSKFETELPYANVNSTPYTHPKDDSLQLRIKVSGEVNSKVSIKYMIVDKAKLELRKVALLKLNEAFVEEKRTKYVSISKLEGVKSLLRSLATQSNIFNTIKNRIIRDPKVDLNLGNNYSYVYDIEDTEYFSNNYNWLNEQGVTQTLKYYLRNNINRLPTIMFSRLAPGAFESAPDVAGRAAVNNMLETTTTDMPVMDEISNRNPNASSDKDSFNLRDNNAKSLYTQGTYDFVIDESGVKEITISLPVVPDNDTTFITRVYAVSAHKDQEAENSDSKISSLSYAASEVSFLSGFVLSLKEKIPRILRIGDISNIGVAVVAHPSFFLKRNNATNTSSGELVDETCGVIVEFYTPDTTTIDIISDDLYVPAPANSNSLVSVRDTNVSENNWVLNAVSDELCISDTITNVYTKVVAHTLGDGKIKVVLKYKQDVNNVSPLVSAENSLSQDNSDYKLVDGLLLTIPIELPQMPIFYSFSHSIKSSTILREYIYPVQFPLGLISSYGTLQIDVSRGFLSQLLTNINEIIRSNLYKFNTKDILDSKDSNPYVLLTVGSTLSILKKSYNYNISSNELLSHWLEGSISSVIKYFTDYQGESNTNDIFLGLCYKNCDDIRDQFNRNTSPYYYRPTLDIALNSWGIFMVKNSIKEGGLELNESLNKAVDIWSRHVKRTILNKIKSYLELMTKQKKEPNLKSMIGFVASMYDITMLLASGIEFDKHITIENVLELRKDYLDNNESTLFKDDSSLDDILALEHLNLQVNSDKPIDSIAISHLKKILNNVRYQGDTVYIADSLGGSDSMSLINMSIILNLLLQDYQYGKQVPVEYELINRLGVILASGVEFGSLSLYWVRINPYTYGLLAQVIKRLDTVSNALDPNATTKVKVVYEYKSDPTTILEESVLSGFNNNNAIGSNTYWNKLDVPKNNNTANVKLITEASKELYLTNTISTNYIPEILPAKPTYRGLDVSYYIRNINYVTNTCIGEDIKQLISGELYCLTVNVLSTDDVSNPVKISILLPAGLEVDDPINVSLIKSIYDMNFFFMPFCNIIAAKSDSIDIECSSIRAGLLTVSVSLRANVPGHYIFPPIRSEIYNQKGLFGLSAGSKVSVSFKEDNPLIITPIEVNANNNTDVTNPPVENLNSSNDTGTINTTENVITDRTNTGNATTTSTSPGFLHSTTTRRANCNTSDTC